jgi:hypothetical protein
MTARVGLFAVLLAMSVMTVAAEEELYIRDVVVEGGLTLTVDTVSYYSRPGIRSTVNRLSMATGDCGIRACSRTSESNSRTTATVKSLSMSSSRSVHS